MKVIHKRRKNAYKYITQPISNICGPTALFNLLRWKKCKYPSSLTFRKLINMCDCDYIYGTYYKNFSYVLKQIEKFTNIKVVKECGNTNNTTYVLLDEIEKHLKNNGCVIILYQWTDDFLNNTSGEHYFLVDKMVKSKKKLVIKVNGVTYNINSKFNCVNFTKKYAEVLLDNWTMLDILSRKKFNPEIHKIHKDPIDNIHPKVWFIN